MGRMGRDTEQDRIGQADTSQKIACGKPESGKQEAPRLWGKRTANSSEIVHTVLGSLEAYLHSNPPDYRFQVESLLELLYYAFTEYNITESPEFKAKIGPLDRKLRDLAETDEYTHNSEYPQKLRAASRQPWCFLQALFGSSAFISIYLFYND